MTLRETFWKMIDFPSRMGKIKRVHVVRNIQRSSPPVTPSPPPAPPATILRGPIVPLAQERTLPPDFTLDVQECAGCGTHWRPRWRDVSVRDHFYPSHHPIQAYWTIFLTCPTCGRQDYHFLYRFRALPGRLGRQGWHLDRQTGRTVRFTEAGKWEERPSPGS